jgi:hypothetical protein
LSVAVLRVLYHLLTSVVLQALKLAKRGDLLLFFM